MIQTIFTFRKELENKEIYVWNINNESMQILTHLAFKRVKIAGFVCETPEFIGQKFLNRPIISIKNLKNRKNILIITHDSCDISGISSRKELEDIELISYSKVIEINENLKDKSVIIYDSESAGDHVYRILNAAGIKIEAVCVSEYNKQNFYHGFQVIQFDDLMKKKHPVIIADSRNREQARRKLNSVGVNDIYYPDLACYSFEQEVFFPAINDSAGKNKKFFIYGNNDEISQMIENVLEDYQIKIDGYVQDESAASESTIDVHDLSYMEPSKLFVIINEEDENKLQNKCETLDNIGFSLEDFNYTAVSGSTALNYNCTDMFSPDILLGEGWLANQKLPGFFIYGSADHTDNIKILILGGSTSSDGRYRPKCWSKYLHEKLTDEGHAVVIFNGAYPEYDVTQELLLLIRDGTVIHPDIVISMSGYNNTILKENMLNQFNVDYILNWARSLDPDCEFISGLKCDESLWDFWVRTESIMNITAELFGAEFYAFLQPMKYTQENLNLFEVNVFEQERRKHAIKEFKKHADAIPGIINISSKFDYEEKCFIDPCHYSDQANRLLADIVYDNIIKTVKILETRREN